MATPPKNVGLSSAIVGSFDPIDDSSANIKNTWAFEYNKTQNSISFHVQVGMPPLMINNGEQHLYTTIATSDIDQLINWLAIVKMSAATVKSAT